MLLLALLAMLFVMTFASVARADELAPPDRVGGKDVFTFLGKDFTTDAEACAAGTPKADGWSPNGASAPNKAGMIECHYKHKDGEKKSLMQVRQSLLCPALSTSKDPDGDIATRFCQCDRGLIAMSGACVPKPADAGAVPAKPKEAAPCDVKTWMADTRVVQRSATTKTNADRLKANIQKKRNKESSPKESFAAGSHAHHIVFSTKQTGEGGKMAQESRDILDSVCIDTNDADNGVMLTPDDHLKTGLHTDIAALKVRDALDKARRDKKPAVSVRLALARLRQSILDGTFMPGYVPGKAKKP